jgi:hypothetical protein
MGSGQMGYRLGDFVYADSTDENGNNITVFGKITNILIEEILT